MTCDVRFTVFSFNWNVLQNRQDLDFLKCKTIKQTNKALNPEFFIQGQGVMFIFKQRTKGKGMGSKHLPTYSNEHWTCDTSKACRFLKELQNSLRPFNWICWEHYTFLENSVIAYVNVLKWTAMRACPLHVQPESKKYWPGHPLGWWFGNHTVHLVIRKAQGLNGNTLPHFQELPIS